MEIYKKCTKSISCVVLGIILVDKSNFAVFEHFLADYESFGIPKTELFDMINSLQIGNSLIYKTVKIDKLEIDSKTTLILVSPENNPVSNETKENLLSITSKVAYGDKEAILHILQSRSSNELTFTDIN